MPDNNKPIELITQPDPHSCVYACVAMLATWYGRETITPARVRASMTHGDHAGSSLQDEFQQWVRLGFLPRLYLDQSLRFGQVCLVTVPSLNAPKLNHRIIVDSREEIRIIDPNQGRKGVKVYQDITSWSEKTTLTDCLVGVA